MKSYNNRWAWFLDEENIKQAILDASKGKKKRKDIKKALENIDNTIQEIKEYVQNFHNDNHTPKVIYDGINRKKRTIIVPSFREQVVHHLIVDNLKDVFYQGIYEYTYGSVPARGAHGGKVIMEKWISNDLEHCKYVLKLDIKKYFEHISHDILKEKLARIIKDKKVLNLLFEVIDATDKGLPLGFYTSQWLAVWYLKDFDHFVKEQCKATHYMRYMDDLTILGETKEELKKILKLIERYLTFLGLELNERSQLFQFCWFEIRENGKIIKHGRDIDFMGFRFFPNKTTLRKSIMYKAVRKAKKIGKPEKNTVYELRQMISYMGYIDITNVYNVWNKYIKMNFNFKKSRKRISNYDKRLAKELQVMYEAQWKRAIMEANGGLYYVPST